MLEPMNPDSEAVYDAEVAPLVERLIALCKAHRIPMLACFQYADASHPAGPGFCTSRVPFAGESPTLEAACRATGARGFVPSVLALSITTDPEE